MSKKQQKVLKRIVVALLLLIAVSILDALVEMPWILRLALYLVPYLVIGYDILKKAGKGILKRQVFDENFLMAVATIGAVCLGEFKEGAAVMLFYQIGELFQSIAVGKSRKNIAALMDIRPDYANMMVDGKLEKVDPDDVEIGSEIIINPGEKVPIDGVITEGNTTLNTSALTGESLPRDVSCGDEIISGGINMTGIDDQEVWRFYRIQDLRSGGKFSHEEIQIRELYHKVCQVLHTGSLLRCSGACYFTAGRAPVYGK